jgi:uncharacterized protein RhaS with RHS repeats
MQQRYYDPEVGRFLSVDPVGVDVATGANFNRYWYGNNNPYRYIDPDGRVPVLVAAAVFAWRAYSAYDTVTSAAENISTLADADASLGDKTMAGLELAASALGGKFGRETTRKIEIVSDGTADGARAGKQFTPKGKAEIDASNAERHGGVNACEECGLRVVPGQKSQRGVTPPGNERHRDHIVPKSKGGDGDPSNGQILCRDCNLKKSDK